MKKEKFLSGLLIAFLFVGCSSDDNGGSSVDINKLYGKWYYHSQTIGGHTIPYDDHEPCGKDYLEFLENGIVRNVDVWDCEEDVDVAPYSVSGNKINITFDEGTEYEETIEWTVKTLNNSTLEIEGVDEDFGKVSAKFTRE